MPTKPERVLVDTSVAVATMVGDHEAHTTTLAQLMRVRAGLAGHAWFETYSVLTRLPPPQRRSSTDVSDALQRSFPETCWLPEDAMRQLAARIADLGIAGGAVYDALVGATALAHSMSLLTRDRRALGTYGALGVDVRLIP